MAALAMICEALDSEGARGRWADVERSPEQAAAAHDGDVAHEDISAGDVGVEP